MATRRKKKVAKVKFELTRSGIAGIGVVVFCIFLWMFLLGIWAGQSLILPKTPHNKSVANVEQNVDEDIPTLNNDGKLKKLHK